VDYDQASTELICALRGKRSQAALNRRLGYRSNAVYTWESGRCHPSMSKFLTLLERVQRDPEKWWLDFARWQQPNGASHAANTAAFMEHLRGNLKVAELARHTGRSRYALMRWLGGKAEPTLPQFLEYVEATTRRVLDLVALLVDPAELPSLAFAWRKLRAARDVAYESPWTHAVLRCLELDDYLKLPAHEPGWLARRLGITPELEAECLDRLAQAGQIKRRARRWAIGKATTIDTRSDRDRDRELRAFWAKLGAERATNARILGYNLFAVSRADEDRIVELTRNYFEAVRTIVSGSAPSERVLLLNLSLLPFEARD
jgi:transcriptional regulator with XRE-family HTH domain